MQLLIDVTRDFERQSNAFEDIDAVLVTHAHADACGGNRPAAPVAAVARA
jgi:phosphoribosyl 1,2-cyclic phosphodiesterase